MKINKRTLCYLIAAVLTIGMVLPAGATDVKDAEKKEQQLEDEKREVVEKQKELVADFNVVMEELEAANQKMSEKEDEIAAAEEELVNAMVDESTQYELMKRRIKYMYESGGTNFLEILFAAEDMADFLTRAEYVSILAKRDKEIFVEFQDIVKDIEVKEQTLKTEYAELADLQDELTEKRKTAETLIAENAKELSDLESELKTVRELIAAAEDAEKRQEEAENANKPSSGNSSGGTQSKPQKPVVSGKAYFTHPCPGMSYQSSYFGEVRESIGDYTPHKGHDYAAAKGTPIYAAAAGKVLIAGYSNSAGYWVVINHGNGLVTKYMHMYSRPYVSAGQTVKKGQHIGGVGTTGQSTGNHLHFQVEEYGVPVNPSKYM